MKFSSLLFCFLVSFWMVGCVKTQPVLSPSFQVTSSKQDVVKKAVESALVGRGWSIVSQKKGEVEARYSRSAGQSVRISVSYSGSSVKIKLIDSVGLLEERDDSGVVVIHKNVNRWLTILERDIQKQVVGLSGL